MSDLFRCYVYFDLRKPSRTEDPKVISFHLRDRDPCLVNFFLSVSTQHGYVVQMCLNLKHNTPFVSLERGNLVDCGIWTVRE